MHSIFQKINPKAVRRIKSTGELHSLLLAQLQAAQQSLKSIREDSKSMSFLSETAFPVGLFLPYPLKLMPTKFRLWWTRIVLNPFLFYEHGFSFFVSVHCNIAPDFSNIIPAHFSLGWLKY